MPRSKVGAEYCEKTVLRQPIKSHPGRLLAPSGCTLAVVVLDVALAHDNAALCELAGE